MADNKVLVMLNEEITDQLNAIAKEDLSTDEMAKRVENVAKLHELRMDELKLEADIEDKSEKRDLDVKKNLDERLEKDADLKERRKDRIWKAAIALLGGAVSYVSFRQGMKFEETGTFASTTVKSVAGNIFRKLSK